MAQAVISVSDLTKKYDEGRGIFDISFEVQPGEVFGYVGTNGSGKTTTIRHLMGFLKQDSGTVRVNSLDPWKKTPELMQYVSYIPGEIAFPSLSTGSDFFKVQAQFLGVKDLTRMNHLIELLALDPSANLKRMSKGMKQKTAVVAALMAQRDILILDEPTTGLDPLMRENFMDIIREEKAMGHTVFMSSHIFEEVEDVCDKVGILHNGKLSTVITLSEFRANSPRMMEITFETEEDAYRFSRNWIGSIQAEATVRCTAQAEEMGKLFSALHSLPVKSLTEKHASLGEYFMHLYQEDET